MRKIIKKPLFDLSQIKEFRDVFPELTEAQFETAMLLSLGLSQGEIAHLRSVHYQVVHQILEDIKVKLDFYSLSNLRAMFQVRLVFFALSECKRNSSTRSASSDGKGDDGNHHA